MLEHQIQRLRLCQRLDGILLATSSLPCDAEILQIAKRLGVAGFAGSEDDVLDRIYKAAKQERADVVVRITGDCPLIDPAVVDQMVEHFLARREELDYLGTGPSYPEGLDTEVMSFAALERSWQEAVKKSEREHVTPYIFLSGRFRTARTEYEQDLAHLRWTVDNESDFSLVKHIYEQLFPRFGYNFGVQEILDLLQKEPALTAINEHTLRNEGFLKSLGEENGKLEMMKVRPLKRSEEYWARAKGLIPAGTQTLSKGPTQFVDGIAPKYLERAQGSHVWDVDGNEYIDLPMALGAIILGHNYPAVSEAILRQMQSGTSFSLMHPIEVEVSEIVRSLVPCAEMVRFAKNGSDATTGAIRVARAYTGREKVAHCGYHGWHDWYIGCTSRNKGVPHWAVEQQFAFTYNSIDSLKEIFASNPGEIAAVIMEPFGVTLPEDGFLEKVKALAHENGAVLIYDEVASGFRFHLGGIHQYFGVDPDLACFGKAIANGMPLSVLAGRSEMMQVLEEEVFFSFTFGGECLSLAAAQATIKEMREKSVIPHLWEMGRRLQNSFNRLASDYGVHQHVQCLGLAPRTFVSFRDVGTVPALIVKSLFQQEAIKRGVLFTGAHCLSYSHTPEDIDFILAGYQKAFEILSKAIKQGNIAEKVEGRPVQSVFRAVN
jgi:glutamate-1-semialdehyde aminotransferase/spore coat polysaccharide biosynthesis protein SpsF (cytidylyltransferase family)